MIVSASYRTDIPALHGRWFQDRLKAGFVEVDNPYGGRPFRVGLTPEIAEGFVFWTKHIDPFLPVLDALAEARRPFTVQFTVTGYGRELERGPPASIRAIGSARLLREKFGPRVLVWRYDPIVIAEGLDAAWHEANFARHAEQLSGTTDEAVVSFMAPYAKTIRNLAKAAIAWRDPAEAEKRDLLARLAPIARSFGMRLTLCTQPDLVTPDIPGARCIDAARLSDVAGKTIGAREKGNRPGCLCAESRDIGAYDTCTLGCAYCYAVANHEAVRQRRRA